jgi:hypothetical protein
MGLLSRFEKLALALSIVILFVLTPTSFPAMDSGVWRCTTQAWASGSPDETLNPQPNPPSKAASIARTLDRSAAVVSTTRSDAAGIDSRKDFKTWTSRWAWVWRIYLTFRPGI